MLNEFRMTIEEVVTLFHPDKLSVTNPKRVGVPTKGDAIVASFTVTYEANRILVSVTIA